MEIGDLAESDRREMEAKVAAVGKSMEAVLNEASGMLSDLTRAAGVVLTAKSNVRLSHKVYVLQSHVRFRPHHDPRCAPAARHHPRRSIGLLHAHLPAAANSLHAQLSAASGTMQ